MSTAARSIHAPRMALAPQARRAVVRWALGAGGAELEWAVGEADARGGGVVTARVREGGVERLVVDGRAGDLRVEFVDDAASRLVHVRVARGGAELLAASVDPSRGVVYARTALLAGLCPGGGRCEVSGGGLETP